MTKTTESKLNKEQELREEIGSMVSRYYQEFHSFSPFVPGVSKVPVTGKVFDALDLQYAVDASLDFWLTTGRFNDEFESKLADFLGLKFVSTVNSGSSANLVAFSSLRSPLLKDRALKPGEEVIAVAAAFPTSVTPILQNGLIPVFVDVDIPTYNIKVDEIEAAISNKTRAIFLAHTLGNPFDVEKVLQLAKKYNLWVIEDCCDALGTTYLDSPVGTFGDLATFSFYPAHHITMGEGGAVATNRGLLKKIADSYRDWGRDCYCPPGKDNTCQKRFCWKLGKLPFGYDHKYIYSHAGYNLKITDWQAAIGSSQMEKLPLFIDKRRDNFAYYKKELSFLEPFCTLPEATKNADPAWFGFPITIDERAPFSRSDLINYLEKNHIATRLLFSGNILYQPFFERYESRKVGSLSNTDRIMHNTFWIGVYPGITPPMREYVVDVFRKFIEQF